MPESKKFLLRLDPRVFEALRRWANDDLRSINAQIEYLLTEQVRRAGRLPRQTTPRPRTEFPDDDSGEVRTDFPTDDSADADLADELGRVESR